MKKLLLLAIMLLYFLPSSLVGQTVYYDKTRDGFLVFHEIKTDANGNIIPWYSENPGIAYDHILNLVWNFWDTMRTDMNGLPYYMNHQVWRTDNDRRGLGGDQLNMALSSWRLLYMYSGNEKVKENMKFIADYYLSHSLSPSNVVWPNIPFPYNTLIYSGMYDGDMVIGKNYTQPDKAGWFGYELVNMYKMTGNKQYLTAAIDIANTLAIHTKAGDGENSPLPFKVNAFNGEVGILKNNSGDGTMSGTSSYTTNWAGTLMLFSELKTMEQGSLTLYQNASDLIITWMLTYPLNTNKWGPFFEDVPGWSDTQINAVTFAQYMMNHQELFPEWKSQVKGIFDWIYKTLGNEQWKKYGVTVVNEQTAYRTPGNSHTSRQGSAELQYAVLSGDKSSWDNALRQLHWATYMVDKDGKNCYPRDEVWLTDGFGDYVRHYLRAMADVPSLAPDNANHILHSTGVVSQADYFPDLNKTLVPDVPYSDLEKVSLYYRTFDNSSIETIRMVNKPVKVMLWKNELPERSNLDGEGWQWIPMEKGGLLKIRHDSANVVTVYMK